MKKFNFDVMIGAFLASFMIVCIWGLALCFIVLFTGCGYVQSQEERLLLLQQQHELEMKKLEMRQQQSADERLQDDIMQGIGSFINGVSKGLQKK